MPVEFSEAIQRMSSANEQTKVLLSFAASAQPWRQQWLHPPTSLVFLCGPEGGLSLQEETLACQHGFVPVSLGHATLRSETAAISVLAQLL
jgi:16S rRNA (uracil1498-N3)-methyltransferase